MASLAERSASPWTATACEIDLCGVLDLRQQLVRRSVWQWTVAGGRRRWFVGGDRTAARIRRRASATRPPQQRATSMTLAATRRHRCRHGMAAADCTWFRSCSESVVAPAALNDHQNLAALIIFAALYARARSVDHIHCPLRAREAVGRR